MTTTNRIIETHVHFNSTTRDFGTPSNIQAMTRRATEAGVTDFVIVGFDLASSLRAVKLAESDPRFWATIGIHPHDAKDWNTKTEQELRPLLTHPRVVAYGEIGLDFYRDLSPRDTQDKVFRAQLALAREGNLPVVIHARDAYDEVIAVLLEDAKGLEIILHCFAGNQDHADIAKENGWYLGVDGPITYKKNDDLRAIFATHPSDKILLETDAPYLTPEPHRGSKSPNEPAHLTHICAKIADIRGESVAKVAAYTTENALRVFRFPST
jgi:TatD DNase family protein